MARHWRGGAAKVDIARSSSATAQLQKCGLAQPLPGVPSLPDPISHQGEVLKDETEEKASGVGQE